MRITAMMVVAAALLFLGYRDAASLAQDGSAEKVKGVGQILKKDGGAAVGQVKKVRGEIPEAVKKRFEAMKGPVDGMELQARVYARLRWDKALNDAKIEVHLLKGGIVLLRGSVANYACEETAVALADQTEGVNDVIDELTSKIPNQVIAKPGMKKMLPPVKTK